ncbi:tetratricopeptide repeat protein [Lentisphaera marina]|uniref:tetratricopeptide repeat protein n=1 Tax=Lentisphaera marina TaxID=1111041 RepID=UPI0023663B67|nr:tetratricopeptide repeat protein [Lentisphaera marina]MDD7986804.1 tetratricopeptide repeat protein [Lentisphaera marina]
MTYKITVLLLFFTSLLNAQVKVKAGSPLADFKFPSENKNEAKLSADEHLQKALNAEFDKKFNLAIDHYKKYLGMKPDDVSIHLRLSDIYNVQKDFDKALELLLKAKDLEQDNPELLKKLYQTYSALNEPDNAFRICEQALNLDSENEVLMTDYCVLAAWAGHMDKAREGYLKLLEKNPDNNEVKFKLYKHLSNEGRLDEAIRSMGDLVERTPHNLEYRLEYSRYLRWVGAYYESLKTLNAAPQEQENEVELILEKARTYAWASYSDHSLKELEKLGSEEQDKFQAMYSKAVAYRQAGYKSDASLTLQGINLPEHEVELKYLKNAEKLDGQSGPEFDAQYTRDSDELIRFDDRVGWRTVVSPELTLKLDHEHTYLQASRKTEFTREDGEKSIDIYRYILSGTYQVERDFKLTAGGGYSYHEEDHLMIADLRGYLRINDQLSSYISYRRRYFDISPRSVSLNIRNNSYETGFTSQYKLEHFVRFSMGYDDLSDGNGRYRLVASHSQPLLRRLKYDLDIGPMALFYGFDNDEEDHGYYDPGFYQRYTMMLWGQYEIDETKQVNANLALGIHRDEDMNSFEPGGDVSAQFLMGLQTDVFFKTQAGYSLWYQDPGEYSAFYVGCSVYLRL